MANILRAPVVTPRGSPSVSRVPHSAQADVTANRGLLIGKDQFYGAAGESKTYDWPNPRGYLYSIGLRGSTQNVALNLIGKDTFFAAPGQAPRYDWPNPGHRAIPTDVLTTADGLEFWLLVTASAPFVPSDWPNPRVAVQPSSGRTHLDWMPFWTPFAQTDWPTPRLRPFALENRTAADATEFWLLVNAASPFAQTEWPNPRGVRGIDLRSWSASLSLLGKDQFFGAPGQPPAYDWPNPRRAGVAIDNYTEADGTEYWLLTSSAAPFSQGDWPNPSTLRSTLASRTHLAWMAFARAFAQRDWPNPRIKVGVKQEWVLSLLPTLYTPPTVRPFGQRDWLNPRRPAPLSVAQQPWSRFALESAPTTGADAACIIQVGPEHWVIAVPRDPRQLSVDVSMRGVNVTADAKFRVPAEPDTIEPEDD